MSFVSCSNKNDRDLSRAHCIYNCFTLCNQGIHQGWGLLSQFLLFRNFPNFSALSKQTLAIEYHLYIWQVSPQLSCGDTCQILMWFEKSNMYFCHIENFAYGEINERSFSNPHPRAVSLCSVFPTVWMITTTVENILLNWNVCPDLHFQDNV